LPREGEKPLALYDFPGKAPHCQQVKKGCAHFWRRSAKNQAFRFNHFAAGRQKGFPLQSFAPHGLTYALTCWQWQASPCGDFRPCLAAFQFCNCPAEKENH
jgi:hypothetical protein